MFHLVLFVFAAIILATVWESKIARVIVMAGALIAFAIMMSQ